MGDGFRRGRTFIHSFIVFGFEARVCRCHTVFLVFESPASRATVAGIRFPIGTLCALASPTHALRTVGFSLLLQRHHIVLDLSREAHRIEA